MKKFIIALSGLPGSGKGHFSKVAKERGFNVFVCGDVVREEVIQHSLPLTRVNLGKAMIDLRDRGGPEVIVKRLQKKLLASPHNKIIVEGIRSLEEVEELKKSFNVIIVAVHTSPDIRFRRLQRRDRSDDPKTLHEFKKRDIQELDIGIGEVIALADKMIVNEGSLNDFTEKVNSVLMEVRNTIES